MIMASILIVDDDPKIRSVLAQYVKEMNHYAAVAESLSEGLEIAAMQPFDLIFMDVILPDGNGLASLPHFRQIPSEPEMIIITAVGVSEGAELAIKSGAWDYIQKPFRKQEIMLQITRALEYRAKKTKSCGSELKCDNVVGTSRQMTECLNQVAQCVGNSVSVLLTGETGTGKELLARTIHKNSRRASGNFVVVDCAALPDKLVESILFGSEKGAFTGAEKDRTGLVKLANNGTLFLDEVGELPLSVQKTFLRVLQEKCFRPIGGNQEIKVDFRLISATNRNLTEMVSEGRFRNDLFYRLRTFHIDIPPLRQRPQDIKDLFHYYLFHLCKAHCISIKGYVPEFLDVLMTYEWPGNVRELVNTLEKCIVSDFDNPTLYPINLPSEIRIHHSRVAYENKSSANGDQQNAFCATGLDFTKLLKSDCQLKEIRELAINEAEKQYLKHILDVTQNNVKQACRVSGLSSSRFYTLARKHGIPLK